MPRRARAATRTRVTTARLLVTAARFLAPGELSVIRNGIELEVFNREVKKALQQQAKNYEFQIFAPTRVILKNVPTKSTGNS